MHDKFCVIDFKKVITGSYNWTYKASHNSENILILDDPSVATQYISRFEQQKAKFQESAIHKASSSSVAPEVVNTTNPLPTMSVARQTTPSVRKCTYCNKEIGYNDAYCQHCGKLQSGNKKTTLVVTCKKCSHKQEEAIIDAMNTKYCTACGSDRLEWEIKAI